MTAGWDWGEGLAGTVGEGEGGSTIHILTGVNGNRARARRRVRGLPVRFGGDEFGHRVRQRREWAHVEDGIGVSTLVHTAGR